MTFVAGYEVDDAITLPVRRDRGIGIVGCGGIVNYAHLPAYQVSGFRVVTCHDRDLTAAERTAADHHIPKVATTLDDLLADDDVEIVDIAVTPAAQVAIAERAAAAGKHLLCQKPLALDYPAAARLVATAREAGVKLAVNQQMRWDAGIRVAHQLIGQGALGQLADARIEVSVRTPWHLWPWMAQSPQLEVMYHSIHYHDSLRFLLGEPQRVTAVHGRFPEQSETGETRTTTVLEYETGLITLVDVNHHNWSDDAYARFRFLGSDGIMTGTIGLLYDYPHGRIDTLSYQANEEPRVWHEAPLRTRWIPDAFAGPMVSLMQAIESGGEPETSGADNLGTLRVVHAAYRSAAEGRSIAPAEVALEAG
jgi:predicted dehydrogenase